jgi:hypothetical protein
LCQQWRKGRTYTRKGYLTQLVFTWFCLIASLMDMNITNMDTSMNISVNLPHVISGGDIFILPRNFTLGCGFIHDCSLLLQELWQMAASAGAALTVFACV